MAFNDDIKRIQVDLTNGTAEEVERVVVAALSAVVISTPVGNPTLWENPNSAPPGYVGGTARGNWQVGIRDISQEPLTNIDPGGGQTISTGKAAVAGYRLGPRIVIGNNVPYIVRLNNGHSTQAPAGFVEKAVQAAVREAGSRSLL